MGEGLRHDVSLSLPLKSVVADRRRRVQGLFEVPLFQYLPAALSAVGPHASEAVGLQLEPHRKLIGLCPATGLLLGTLHIRGEAKQVLDVMPDFVRDHVGLCEIARGAKAPSQLVVEREIDVEFAIGGQ